MARKSPPDTLRHAVDRTVQATVGQAQMTRERAQELVDELAGTAGRVREALDDLRLASGDDVKTLRARLETLERRVAELEREGAERAAARTERPAKANARSGGGAKKAKAGAKAKAKGKG
jgi:polyhydroxyalkanoate synthesis regulator phasin